MDPDDPAIPDEVALPDEAAAEGRGPTRTCIGCGEGGDRGALIRLVLSPDGELVVDLRARLPGRGAWVHPEGECVRRIGKDPRRLGRALKAQVRLQGDDLLQTVRDAVLRAVLDGMSLASAGGALLGGHDVVVQGLRNQRIVEVVFSSDAADRTVNDVERELGDRVATRVPLDKDTLGERVGQPPRAVLGLVGVSGFRHLREQLRRLRSLG